MQETIRTVALSGAQRAFVARIMAARAEGGAVTLSPDDARQVVMPEVGVVLDGTAVPEEERRDPVIRFLEGPAMASRR